MVGFSGLLVQYKLIRGPVFHWCADRHFLGVVDFSPPLNIGSAEMMNVV